MKVNLSQQQLQILVRAEGCDCTDEQWRRRGEHCTMQWARCIGRATRFADDARRGG
jgi:hypothetical protein